MSDFSVQMYDADGTSYTLDSYIDDIDNIDLIKRNRLYDLECPSLEISIPRSYSTTPERNFGIEVIYDSAVVFAGYITSVQEDIAKDIYKLKVDHILYKLKNITLDYTNLHADFEYTSDPWQLGTYYGGNREFLSVLWAAIIILDQTYDEINFGSYGNTTVSGVGSSPLFVDSDYNIEDIRFDYQCFWALNQEYALAQSMIDDETEDYYDEYQEKKPTLFDVFQDIAKFLDLIIYFEDGFQINTKSNMTAFSPADSNKWEYKQKNIQAEYNNLKVSVSYGLIGDYYNSTENSITENTYKAIEDEAKTNFKDVDLMNNFFVYSSSLETNFDFESWTGDIPDVWNYNDPNDLEKSNDSQEGTYSILLKSNEYQYGKIWQNVYGFPVNDQISFNFYYKQISGDALVKLRFHDYAGSNFKTVSIPLSGTYGSWEEHTETINDISDAVWIFIQFEPWSNDTKYDNINMEGFQITGYTEKNLFADFTNYKAEYYINDYVEEEITAPLAATANDVTNLNLDIKKNERNIKQESGAVTETFPYTLPATLGNRL